MNNNTRNIIKLRDFSKYPGGRDIKSGKYSAEEFRDTIVIPKLKESISKQEQLTINLDGTAGIAYSFLEELFGGLIRKNISIYDIEKYLIIISKEEPELLKIIQKYIKDADKYRFCEYFYSHVEGI